MRRLDAKYKKYKNFEFPRNIDEEKMTSWPPVENQAPIQVHRK